MVEGKVQIEGEVIHVIVKQCHNISKLLRHLTASASDDASLLTLVRPDEKSAPPQNKRIQVQKIEQESLFPEARNFK